MRDTFLLKPFLKFQTFLLLVSFLFTEKTLFVFLNVKFRRNLLLPFLTGLRFSFLSFILRHQHDTFSWFHQWPSFLLNTHGHQLIDRPLILMCVVKDFERSILKRKNVKDKVNQKGAGFRHFYFELIQLSHYVPYLHDVFAYTSYTSTNFCLNVYHAEVIRFLPAFVQ